MTSTHWVGGDDARKEPVDFEILQESALAFAQATMQNAINDSGIKRADLARRMGKQRSYVTRMLRGDHNLTIKTFALALAACGYRARFAYGPLYWNWMSTKRDCPAPQRKEPVPTAVGTFMPAP